MFFVINFASYKLYVGIMRKTRKNLPFLANGLEIWTYKGRKFSSL